MASNNHCQHHTPEADSYLWKFHGVFPGLATEESYLGTHWTSILGILQNKALFYQNNGHLGSRCMYTNMYHPMVSPSDMDTVNSFRKLQRNMTTPQVLSWAVVGSSIWFTILNINTSWIVLALVQEGISPKCSMYGLFSYIRWKMATFTGAWLGK